MSVMDIDTDLSRVDDLEIDGADVLNLEEEYYRKGYEEGQKSASSEQLKEGKEYGYQTGFQRCLIIGYIQGLAEMWERDAKDYEEIKSFSSHLAQLKDIIDYVPTTNDDADIQEFESRLKKARNKVRVICTLLKEGWRIENLDLLMKQIGGQLQVSENVDEMW